MRDRERRSSDHRSIWIEGIKLRSVDGFRPPHTTFVTKDVPRVTALGPGDCAQATPGFRGHRENAMCVRANSNQRHTACWLERNGQQRVDLLAVEDDDAFSQPQRAIPADFDAVAIDTRRKQHALARVHDAHHEEA